MVHEEYGWQDPDGTHIYAQTWKPEAAPRGVIALVHGLGEHSGRYQHVAEKFTGAGYVMMGFDLRGHGKSDGKRGHAPYAEVNTDVDHLVKEAHKQYPGLPVFLYGHSLGGALVLNAIMLQNQRDIAGAIVTSPGLAPAKEVGAVKFFAARVLSALAPSVTMANDLDLNGLSHDPAVKAAYTSDPLVHGMISTRTAMDLINNGKLMQAYDRPFPVPLLIMQGAKDSLVNPKINEEFMRKLTGPVTTKVFPNFFHEMHNEPEKELVFKVMLDWLDQQK